MAIKIELQTEAKLPSNVRQQVSSVLDALPREHTRGIERVRIVDSINDPRIRVPHTTELPGLYHPRQGTQSAWLEIAANALLPPKQTFHKRLMSKLSLKSNIAALTISLVGQHYHLTMRHSLKKGQLEPAIRAYTEKHLKLWGDRQGGWRTRLFKPLQPTFEKWAKSLQRQAAKEKKKSLNR
jgi:hypothetical protein